MSFKSGLTQQMFLEFKSSINQKKSKIKNQSSSSLHHSSAAFVYVDDQGVKYVANLLTDLEDEDDVFALSVAEDGFMEILTVNKE